MTNNSENILRLLVELVKFYSQKTLGDGALTIIAEGMVDIAGEDISGRISNFINNNSQKLLSVFREADQCFIDTATDNTVRQTIISKPFSALSRLEKIALRLPATLDDNGMILALSEQFRRDWPKKLSDQQINAAVELYLHCLDRSLATKLDQLLPTIFRKVERIEVGIQQLRSNQQGFQNQFQEFENSASNQSNLLMQQITGVSNQLKLKDLELPLPDDVTIAPSIYLHRDGLLQDLKRNLDERTWLALTDGAGKGKTQLAASIYNSHHNSKKCWITLRHKGNLSDRHLHSQIIRWLFQITDQAIFLQKYLQGQIAFAEIITTLAKSIGSGSLLVIDDLPNPVDNKELYDDLEIIFRAFSTYSSKIVTTSQWAIPPYLESNLPLASIIRSCPYFSLEEILELLRFIQIPSEMRNEKVAAWISATTKGHPSLVTATLSWLIKQGTEVRLEIYNGLISGEPVRDTLEYSRKVLVGTLDERSKELLYRLSLAGEKMDKKSVLDIANIPPSISNPGEALDNLIGPWVDRLDRDYLDVSPLLLNIGRDNVKPDVQRSVYLLCAERYLSKDTFDASSLYRILAHLWSAQDYVRFATILVQALMSTRTRAQAKYLDWACALLLGVNWPDEIGIDSRIMIRAAQVRTLALAEEDYSRANDDLDLLISQTSADKNAHALLFANMTAGLMAENLALNLVISRSFAAIQLANSSRLLKRDFPREVFDQMPDIIWATATRIKERNHIKTFIDALNSLNQQQRELFYNSPLAVEMASHLIDQSWLLEANKPHEKQNWNNILSFLDELSEVSCVKESECFRVAVARSRAVIYADYLKQSDTAIAILNELSGLSKADAIFLVNYSKGCFASDASNNTDAVGYFTNSETIEGDGFSYYRIDNTRRLAIEFSRQGKWDDAKKYCIKAIHQFRKREDDKNIGEIEACEMLGELAYIYWVTGRPEKACGAMYGYVNKLVNNDKTDSLRYKEAFNKAGHGLGWFIMISSTGKPPTSIINGDEYAPVQPGLFGIRRMKIGEFVSTFGFSKSLILMQQAMFAGATNLLRMSWNFCKLSLEYSKLESLKAGVHSVGTFINLSSLESMYGDPRQALRYGLYAKKIFAILKTLRNESPMSTLSGLMEKGLDDYADQISIEEFKDAEKKLHLTIFGPLFAKLIGSNLPTTLLVHELDIWESEIEFLRAEFYYPKEWLKLVQHFKLLILFWREQYDLDEEFMLFDDRTLLDIFRTLLSSDRQKISVGNAYILQSKAAISLPQYGEFSKYMFLGIGKFIHRYWLKVAQTRRFELRHPNLFLDDIKNISPNLGAITVYKVLTSAREAVGVTLSSEAREQIKKIEISAKPWLQYKN